MGTVRKSVEMESREGVIGFLNEKYSFERHNGGIPAGCGEAWTRKGALLDDIQVSVTIDGGTLTIEKLVSLKAFLLSKEEGMSIPLLLKGINRVMGMAEGSLKMWGYNGLECDDALLDFFAKASIDVSEGYDHVILNDGRRKARFPYFTADGVKIYEVGAIAEVV